MSHRRLIVLITLTACKNAGPPDTVEESLTLLGVDITPSDRVDAGGESLPEDYAPIGSSPRLNLTHEWMVSGVALASGGDTVTLLETEAGGEHHLFTSSTVPWADAGRVRDVVAGDIDGDGLDETLAVYRDASDITWIQALDDEEQGFALGEPFELSRADVTDVAAVAGDFDGDSADEVAVALTTVEGSVVVRVTAEGTSFASGSSALLDLPLRSDAYSHWVELASGNVDHDRGEELVVVVNESRDDDAPARLAVLDDAARDFELLLEDTVHAATDLLTGSAPLAGVAVGDLDDDGLDEIVLGGLENPGAYGSCHTYDHLLVVLDDARTGFATRDAERRSIYFDECVAYAPFDLQGVHVNVLNIDGDRGLEIAFNQFVYDDLTQQSELLPLVELPDEAFLLDPSFAGDFHRGTSDVAVGDVTGDGADDLVLISQSAGYDIVVWGMHPIDGWSEQLAIAYQGVNSHDPQWVDLTAVDVDPDGLALAYDDGAYQLVFSEPVILAALSAAPCDDRIDQNLDACRTSWGTSTSETSGIDGSVTVSAGITAGFGSEAFGFGGEVTETVTYSASFSAGTAYETTKTVAYTTGPLEDAVVFTSIPYDQWTYTVTSHPDPDLIGEQIVLSMPREPVTLMVERGFYNASVIDGSTLVLDSVFPHVVGDPTSYRTASERDALIGSDGLVSDVVTVGQGAGETSVAIDVSQSTTYRAGAEVSYSRDVQTTSAGVIFGVTVGGSVDAGISWGSGEATHYQGTVGQIAASDFADHYYSYGLFTYIADAGEQQFEVVDYWVE